MTLCEFCILRETDAGCSKGLKTPKKMKCVDFAPSIEQFCARPADDVSRAQLKQMANYFGFAGNELKLVLAMSGIRS